MAYELTLQKLVQEYLPDTAERSIVLEALLNLDETMQEVLAAIFRDTPEKLVHFYAMLVAKHVALLAGDSKHWDALVREEVSMITRA